MTFTMPYLTQCFFIISFVLDMSSTIAFCLYAVCPYAECHILFIVMLIVIIVIELHFAYFHLLSIIMRTVVHDESHN